MQTPEWSWRCKTQLPLDQELALHQPPARLGESLDIPLVGLKVQGAAQNSKPLLSEEVDIPDHTLSLIERGG